jgi:hypothetical protein
VKRSTLAAALAGVLFGVFAATAMPATAEAQPAPDATDLLFDQPQWGAAQSGATLTYRYARKASDEALFGPSFDDRIRLKLENGAAAGNRTVEVDMFSGSHHRPAGPFEDVSSNPVLLLFLENHVVELSQRLAANPRYLKNAIRAALRDRAVIEAAEITFGGKPLAARRITITPFAEDPNRARLKGLETLTYAFVVADSLPGRIADLHITAPLGNGTIGLDERLVYDSNND